MEAYIEDGRLAGVMTMVARRGHVVHWDAVGLRDMEAGDPLEPDDIFRIYSMTKPITTVAVMTLIEEGKVSLDDPVSKFIPEFGDVTVLRDDGDRVPPTGPITVQHLLTHTSGLTYGFFGDSPVDRLYNESGVFFTAQGLDNFATGVARLPLLAHPDARWNYGVSTDVVGRVIEVASGQSFDAFVQARVLDPLEMTDTAFQVPPDKRDRLTANYARPDGTLQMTDSPTDGQYTRPPAWLSGGGGLTSTASDYIRFAQMLLHEGQLGDARILAAETVRTMRTNHLPDALAPIALGNYLSPAYGFGLGFAVVVDEHLSPEPDNDGVFRWAGAANTMGRRGQHLLLDRSGGGANPDGVDAVRRVRRVRDRGRVPDAGLRRARVGDSGSARQRRPESLGDGPSRSSSQACDGTATAVPHNLAPQSHTAGIFPRRALYWPGAASMTTSLGATLDVHHGLLEAGWPTEGDAGTMRRMRSSSASGTPRPSRLFVAK